MEEYHWLHVDASGRIKGMGCGAVPAPEDGLTIDLEGRTVLPGLADSHSLHSETGSVPRIPRGFSWCLQYSPVFSSLQ